MPKKNQKGVSLLDLNLKKANREMEDLIVTLSNLIGILIRAHGDVSQIKKIHKNLDGLQLNEKASLLMSYLAELQKQDNLFFRMANDIVSP